MQVRGSVVLIAMYTCVYFSFPGDIISHTQLGISLAQKYVCMCEYQSPVHVCRYLVYCILFTLARQLHKRQWLRHELNFDNFGQSFLTLFTMLTGEGWHE